MYCIDQLGCENEGFGAVFRIQTLISPPKAEHFVYAVGMTHFEEQRWGDIGEARAETSAGNNSGASFRRIEEQVFARARQFKEEAVRRPRINGTNDRGRKTIRIV